MLSLEIEGRAGDTIKATASDAVQNLDDDTDLVFKNSDGDLLTGLLISIATYSLKFCHGSDPVQGAGELGHILVDKQYYVIRHPANAKSFNFINETNGENAVLMLTPYYGSM